MILASGWWGYGLYRYFDEGGLPIEMPTWFGHFFVYIIFMGSAWTAFYILAVFIHMIVKCWDD